MASGRHLCASAAACEVFIYFGWQSANEAKALCRQSPCWFIASDQSRSEHGTLIAWLDRSEVGRKRASQFAPVAPLLLHRKWYTWYLHAVFEFASFSRQISLFSFQTPPMTLSRSGPPRHISRVSRAAVFIASSADTKQRRRGRSATSVSRQ